MMNREFSRRSFCAGMFAAAVAANAVPTDDAAVIVERKGAIATFNLV